MIRIAVIGLSIFSLFVFPWPVTLLLGFIASLFFPPVALVLGVAAEFLYGAHGVPYALLAGAVSSVIAYVLRGFVKERIMDV